MAIRRCVRGQSYVTPLATEGVVGLLSVIPSRTRRRNSRRGSAVLQLLAEGRSMKQVGGVLCRHPAYLAFHKYPDDATAEHPHQR
jgi:DNA-binding NarL/FixJ family response regulator